VSLLPEGWELWPLADRKALFVKLKAQEAKDKELNPLGWYHALPGPLGFHSSEARWRLMTGGNRSGKTEAGAAELLFQLEGKSPFRGVRLGPLAFVASSLTFDVQRYTMVKAVEKLIPKVHPWKLTYSRDTKMLEGPNGYCEFKSDEQGWESAQGRALDGFWLDEEHREEFFNQLTKRLKAGSRLEGWFTMTAEPDKSDHWTYERLALPALESDEYAHFECDLEDNRVSRGGYIMDSEIDQLIAMTPVEHRPAVIHGKYVKRGGLIYPDFDKAVHVKPDRPLRDWLQGVESGAYTAFCALDWGVRNPTAILLILEDGDGNCHVVDEIYRPARDVLDIKREYNKRFKAFRPTFVVADPSIWSNHDSTDPERTIAGQLERDDRGEGLHGIPLFKADNDWVNGSAAMRDLMRVDPVSGPKLRIQSRCVKLVWELENYVGEEWLSRQNERNKKETARRQHDHACDALRYFALAPHRHVAPRWKRKPALVVANPVTGYIRARA
jgi:phage terminase large subunit-like protein